MCLTANKAAIKLLVRAPAYNPTIENDIGIASYIWVHRHCYFCLRAKINGIVVLL